MIYVIPLIIALVLITAMIKKLPSYELFIDGAEEGMKIVSGIFPPLVAVLTAAYMLRASGTLDLIVSLLSPITNLIPAEVMPLALIRPIRPIRSTQSPVRAMPQIPAAQRALITHGIATHGSR